MASPTKNKNYISKDSVLTNYQVTDKILSKLEERNPKFAGGSSENPWTINVAGKTLYYEPAIQKLFVSKPESSNTLKYTSTKRTSHQEALRETFPASDAPSSWASGSPD
tara:strand:- start:70 stop:396 length:327 start_codon:yes stop_codon:yes gene_type:complete